jgi:adenylosuccinate lyase
MSRETYESPLAGRYAGKEMSANWSPQKKHSTWRRLWLALAEAEKELGLNITGAQISEMAAHLDDIDFAAAEKVEREIRHDVMSHIHVFGAQCPSAKPVIHLGATSCDITDNAELIQLRDALLILRPKLSAVIEALARRAAELKDMPALGFTHYQPAQLTTVGKRLTLYIQDFVMDMERLEREIDNLAFRSIKGTTGTQASYLELFDGDHDKVKALEQKVAARMGFKKIVAVSGQTYSRKVDYFILSALSGIAQSAHKFACDIRLLSNLKEIEEPFEKSQVGSSAMAYKRNPMRSERICSLSRYVMSLPANAAATHAGQWFERTLDDSANRRIVLAEAFLTVDVILSLAVNVASGFAVWPKMIARHIAAELPFMATENIIAACVKAGGDRQDIHEAIRRHSMEAAKTVKEGGGDNDLIERIRADSLFAPILPQMDKLLDPTTFTGRASAQAQEYLDSTVLPLLARLKKETGGFTAGEVNV